MTATTVKPLPDSPVVSFVVATWQEARFVEPCVKALVGQHYGGPIEVLVVDGGSTDGTVEIVQRLAGEHPEVRLLHNPRQVAPAAFNIGVDAASGDVVSLIGAHSVPPDDYAAVLVDAFAETGAMLVGGRAVPVEVHGTTWSRAVERAMGSPFGVGNAGFRYATGPGWVDTAFPGAYRRELFDQIGTFDERLVRNQDDDFHLRARLAGHRMWFEPRLATAYHPRAELRALGRQYNQYGYWRAATLVKHRRFASVRQAAPGALVAGLVAGPILALRWPRLRWPVAAGVLAWLGLLGAAARREQGKGASGPEAGATAAAVATMHVTYGAGFWAGAVAHLRRWSDWASTGPGDRSGGKHISE